MIALTEIIRKRLAQLQPRILTAGYEREASVLIPIFEAGGEPHLLLTRRTEEVETHKGQISFPGGMRESEESLETAALRETFEEVGIDPSFVTVLGRFHDYYSSTGFRVVPFAGRLTCPFTTRAQPQEVAEILQVPLSVFRDPSLLRVEEMERGGKKIPVFFYTFGKHEIWGLTARIIKDFLEEIDWKESS